jgi:hypothetical protein
MSRFIRVEFLADAITEYSGYLDPSSPLYVARNPGGLKATSPRHTHDAEGNRVFSSVLDGMQALLHDLAIKLSGRSWAKLKPSDTLVELAAACGQSPSVAAAWCNWLRKCPNMGDVSPKTELIFFLKD